MKRTDLFVPTTKETTSDASVRSAELAVRSGLVDKIGSGVFSFSPTGNRVRNNLKAIIRDEMQSIDAQEVDLPGLQYAKIWRESDRFDEFEGEMFTFKNRDDQDMCLAPTHEEPMAEMVRNTVRSRGNLPLLTYQIGKKYRDEHARNGLLRTKEFEMKDAYSFHTSEEALDEMYDRIRESYINIFERLGLEYAIVDADPGAMGGTGSEEFQAPADIGSDEIKICTNDDCRWGSKEMEVSTCEECSSDVTFTNAIELGHIFKLGTRYSDPLDLTYDTEEGKEQIIMGSYGIGVSRLIPALIEQRNDSDGIIWPESVAPFSIGVVPVGDSDEIDEMAAEIEQRIGSEDVLVFDNDVNAGEKFAEADLIGIPNKAILGNTFIEEGTIEVEFREGGREYYQPEAFFEQDA
jgi:prolyl-tRNA synthetase